MISMETWVVVWRHSKKTFSKLLFVVFPFLFLVKLWSTDMEHSVACLEAKANVCCVKFNPESRYHLSFGSAGMDLCAFCGNIILLRDWFFFSISRVIIIGFTPCTINNFYFSLADHCVHYYDLRNTTKPITVFKGHRKAVSYTKFINTEEIVSA